MKDAQVFYLSDKHYSRILEKKISGNIFVKGFKRKLVMMIKQLKIKKNLRITRGIFLRDKNMCNLNMSWGL